MSGQTGRVVACLFRTSPNQLAEKSARALQRLADRFAGKPVAFYSVSIKSNNPKEKSFAPDAELCAFAARVGLRVLLLRDPEKHVFRAFGLDAIPVLIILGRESRVAEKFLGFDPDQPGGFTEAWRLLDRLTR